VKAAFAVAALAYFVFAILNMWKRPGFLAAAFLASYGLAYFFGPLGAVLGVATLFATVTFWTTASPSNFRSPPQELALGIWTVLSLLTILGSLNFGVSMQYGSALVVLAGGSYLIGRTFGADDKFVDDLVIGSIILLLICAPAIVSSFFQKAEDQTELNSVGLAVIAEVPLIAAMALLIFKQDLRRTHRLGLLGLFFAVILPFQFLLGNRSSLLGAAFVFLCFAVVRIRRGNATIFVAAIASGLVAMIGMLIFVYTELQNVVGAQVIYLGVRHLVSNFALSSASHVYIDPSAQARLNLYSAAKQIILDAPMFGHGLGSFGSLADWVTVDTYPHNMFLEVIVTSGIVGLAIFLAFYIPTLWFGISRGWRRAATWETLFVIGLFLDASVRHQVSLSITTGKVLFMMGGILAARRAREILEADDAALNSPQHADLQT
jgi:O-antigen ligase